MSHELLIELGLITARPHIHTHWIIQSGRSINQMTTFYIMYTLAIICPGLSIKHLVSPEILLFLEPYSSSPNRSNSIADPYPQLPL